MKKYLQHIWFGQRQKTLADFIRLAFAFFGCLAVLSAYQFLRLYLDGVLPTLWNSSFFSLLINHSGLAALVSLFLVFIFHFLERRRKLLGFGIAAGVFLALLILEGFLIEYYVRYYEILGVDFAKKLAESTASGSIFLSLLVLIPITTGLMLLFYKINSSSYKVINKMYPFTVIVITWFLATLISEKNPVNVNKTQHLAEAFFQKYTQAQKYQEAERYPLLKTYKREESLLEYFDLKAQKPNVVFIVMDGLESEFIHANSPIRDVMPYFQSLSKQSLRWDNHMSNASGSASLPVIIGSLPIAESKLMDSDLYINRNTLFSILKDNGYHTSYHFGGNSALGRTDRFLTQERVDDLIDNKDFGRAFTRQDQDAAGVSLGYPDKELFRHWNDRYTAMEKPRLEVFHTLSTQGPWLIPDRKQFREKVDDIIERSNADWGTRRKLRSNRSKLASMNYADEALRDFIEAYYRSKPGFGNTIFIITGNRELRSELQNEQITATRVPLLIFSPMVKEPVAFKNLVSHADIVPALLGTLDEAYGLNMPEFVAWTGNNLHPEVQDVGKQIPIYSDHGAIESLILNNFLFSEDDLYKLGKDGSWHADNNKGMEGKLSRLLKETRLRNEYLISENRIMPGENTIFKLDTPGFSKREIAWINTVIIGDNYDAAYRKARELALNNESRHALLLCQYILARVPGHVDTEILMARMYGWQHHYDKASEILEETIRKYPNYASGYEALLDIYYWSNDNDEALEVARLAEENDVRDQAVWERITRAKNILNSRLEKNTVSVLPEKVRR